MEASPENSKYSDTKVTTGYWIPLQHLNKAREGYLNFSHIFRNWYNICRFVHTKSVLPL